MLPTCKPEENSDEHDNLLPSQIDLDDGDTGLTFEKVRAHQVLVEDLGEDLGEDFRTKSHDDGPDLKFVSDFTPKEIEQGNSLGGEDCEDNGEWLLDQLDLTGLDEWPEELQIQAKNMLKRNTSIFIKHDLDMGKTDLVKLNIVLTDPIPFKEKYTTIPPQFFSEVKANLEEMLDLGSIRHSNSPWASAIVLVWKKRW